MKTDDMILLEELRGHPVQDCVDTVRGVFFDLYKQNETKPREPNRPGEKGRGSERVDLLPAPEGVRADQLNVNEYLVHRIAVSLFLKNKMS